MQSLKPYPAGLCYLRVNCLERPKEGILRTEKQHLAFGT